jgi:hypothetical protein
MRRTALVATALLIPLVPLVSAAPAHAADNVICVGSPVGTCHQTVASLSAAVNAANANSLADTILVGPGTYDDGPYQLLGQSHGLTLQGSGQGSTIITLPASPTTEHYVVANQAVVVRDLTIQMAPGPSGNDTGLVLFGGATAVRVTVDGTGTANATGMKMINSAVTASAVHMPLTRAMYGEGGATVTDSTLSGSQGFVHSGPDTTDTLSRVTIEATGIGISTDSGTVLVDNALIDLGAGAGTGLAAANFNANPDPNTIEADHVTIVGGGPGSRGAWAYAANPNEVQQSTIQLDNSIVRGPETDLVVQAGNDGAQGGPSTATINATYSAWSTKDEAAGANGIAEVVSGQGHLHVDPAFVNPAAGNYRLRPGSPVIDKGDPAAAGPTRDLDRRARVIDGDLDGTAVRDLGAYEWRDTVAPNTRITSKPAKRVRNRRVTFRFIASEPGSTFRCKLDRRAWRPCSSPKTFKVKLGKHRFAVRATDAAGNSDATPAKYAFSRVPKRR